MSNIQKAFICTSFFLTMWSFCSCSGALKGIRHIFMVSSFRYWWSIHKSVQNISNWDDVTFFFFRGSISWAIVRFGDPIPWQNVPWLQIFKPKSTTNAVKCFLMNHRTQDLLIPTVNPEHVETLAAPARPPKMIGHSANEWSLYLTVTLSARRDLSLNAN